MIVVFTIGHTKSYDQAITDHSDECFKIGRDENYEGGWIWKTAEEAQAFIWSENFLKVDWGDNHARPEISLSIRWNWLMVGLMFLPFQAKMGYSIC